MKTHNGRIAHILAPMLGSHYTFAVWRYNCPLADLHDYLSRIAQYSQ
jgi:hypothetical protein